MTYDGTWQKAMDVFVETYILYILISGFLAFLEVKVLGKVLILILHD